MGMRAYFSNRIYKHSIQESHIKDAQHTLFVFNQAKHFRVQDEIREKRNIKGKSESSIHQRVKVKFGLNDYYDALTDFEKMGLSKLESRKANA